MIEVKKSDVHGRGVFATQFIPKGTELVCDVILINKELEENYVDINIFSFPWNKTHYSICMGFASFFNHNRKPNIKNKRIDKENLKDYFITLEDINVGDELFIDYGNKKLEYY